MYWSYISFLSLQAPAYRVGAAFSPAGAVRLTLVPAVTESTFAQDVIIRDGSGFLLVSDSLQGRIINRYGITAWAGDRILQRVWRRAQGLESGRRGPGAKLVMSMVDTSQVTQTDVDPIEEDLSADLYGQLSQLMFNAKIQWQVLQDARPEQTDATWR